MTWLTPLTGLFLALAVIPPLLLLYFLKLRRKSQPIACTLLWKRSVDDLQANAPFQRIRWNILLLLQLLALILLILSVMQPRVQAGTPAGGRTVFLIDNSASMSATDGPDGITRLELAKRAAKERIEQMYTGGLFAGAPGEAMIVAFSDRAEVFARFTNSRQQLLDAVDRIPQTHGETRIDEALKLARAFTTNVNPDEQAPVTDGAYLELYSDGRISDLADQVLRNESITFHSVGAEQPDNIAIASIAAERPFDRPNSIEVFASLINFNRTEVICDVQLSVNGTARGIREVRVPAAEDDPSTGVLVAGRNNIVFSPFEQPHSAVIEVANLREDDLKSDNIAQLVVPPPQPLSVALVTRHRAEKSLLHMALEGLPMIERLDLMPPAQFEAIASGGQIDGYDVVVLDNVVPSQLPPGRYLTFAAAPPLADSPINEYGRSDSPQHILDARDTHPVMRYVNLDDLVIYEARLVQPSDEVEVLAVATEGPVILSLRRGPLHVVHATFDILDTTWPFHFGYVTFLQNAIEFLGHSGEALTSVGFKPGQALTARLPAAASEIELRLPDGRTERLAPIDPAQLSWGPIIQTGLHVLTWAEPGASNRQMRPLAVNLLSETEGHIAVQKEIEIGQERHTGRSADGARYIPLWPWAIGLCLALLMIEWWMYHRKTAV